MNINEIDYEWLKNEVEKCPDIAPYKKVHELLKIPLSHLSGPNKDVIKALNILCELSPKIKELRNIHKKATADRIDKLMDKIA